MFQAEDVNRKGHFKCWKRRVAGTERIWSKGVNALVSMFQFVFKLLNYLQEQEAGAPTQIQKWGDNYGERSEPKQIFLLAGG
jgi:hypothetical protein